MIKRAVFQLFRLIQVFTQGSLFTIQPNMNIVLYFYCKFLFYLWQTPVLPSLKWIEPSSRCKYDVFFISSKPWNCWMWLRHGFSEKSRTLPLALEFPFCGGALTTRLDYLHHGCLIIYGMLLKRWFMLSVDSLSLKDWSCEKMRCMAGNG